MGQSLGITLSSWRPLCIYFWDSYFFRFVADRITYSSSIYQTLSYAAYVKLHLPNLKHAQMAATRAAANLVAATAYSTLENESKRLRSELAELKRKRPPRTNKTKNKNKKATGTKRPHADTGKSNQKRAAIESAASLNYSTANLNYSTANLNYCYAHGYQQSHTPAACKVLSPPSPSSPHTTLPFPRLF